ncbi:hypothetical protein Hanom_Chr14g01250931 [Helianthus anomalus]
MTICKCGNYFEKIKLKSSSSKENELHGDGKKNDHLIWFRGMQNYLYYIHCL